MRARNNTSCSARRRVSASTSIGSRPSNSRHEALCEASMRPCRSLWASTLPISKYQRFGTSAGPSFRRSSSMSVCGDAWSANNHEIVIEQSSTNTLTGGLRPAEPVHYIRRQAARASAGRSASSILKLRYDRVRIDSIFMVRIFRRRRRLSQSWPGQCQIHLSRHSCQQASPWRSVKANPPQWRHSCWRKWSFRLAAWHVHAPQSAPCALAATGGPTSKGPLARPHILDAARRRGRSAAW